MDPALQALLDDFAQRHADHRFATDAQGHTVLLFDDERVVNFIHEPNSGLLWALAMIGRLPSKHAAMSEPIGYGDQWISHTHEVDGFECSILSNVDSGVIALVARAAMSSLDTVAFDQWMSAFLDRLSVTSSVFPKDPQLSGEAWNPAHP